MIQIDMKMPSSCYDCPFVKNERTNDYGSFCECGILEDCETINLLKHNKHPNCPLIEQESMLDKIRAEIEEQVLESLSDGGDDWFTAEKVNECLEIIDKYRAESSEDRE